MKTIHLLFLTLFSVSVIAQTKLTKKQISELPNTIENQFVKTYSKASTYQEYKMIKRTDFRTFEKSVLDSVQILRKEIVTRQETINNQTKSIDDLNNKISGLTEELNESQGKEDNMSLLGANISKTSYNLTLWSLIAILTLVMLFFIFKFKSSNVVTKQAKRNLEEIEQEFETHRKKSIEKEQKLRRQLQDEINKQRGV